MNKFVLVALMMTLMAFSTPAMACVSTNCYCPPPPADCTCEGAITRTAPYVLDSLEHRYFYIWEMDNLALAPNERITEAGIWFKGINDWRVEDGDKMYISLLNSSQIGDAVHDLSMQKILTTSNSIVYRGNDGVWLKRSHTWDGDADNDLGGYSTYLATYEDKNEKKIGCWWYNPPENYCYVFADANMAALENAMRNGPIGIGLDADCWYTFPDTDVCKIKFWYCTTTTTIPAPDAIFLGSVGVALVGWLRRRRTL